MDIVNEQIKSYLEKSELGDSEREDILLRLPNMTYLEKTFILEELKKMFE